MSNKVTEMNSKNADVVRQILEKKLPSVLQEHGLKFTLGNAVYDDDGVRFTGFKVTVAGALSVTERALERELDYRRRTPEIIELDSTKIVKVNGRPYVLSGYRTKARKYTFLAMNPVTGKEYMLTRRRAEQWFGIKGTATYPDAKSLSELDKQSRQLSEKLNADYQKHGPNSGNAR